MMAAFSFTIDVTCYITSLTSTLVADCVLDGQASKELGTRWCPVLGRHCHCVSGRPGNREGVAKSTHWIVSPKACADSYLTQDNSATLLHPIFSNYRANITEKQVSQPFLTTAKLYTTK